MLPSRAPLSHRWSRHWSRALRRLTNSCACAPSLRLSTIALPAAQPSSTLTRASKVCEGLLRKVITLKTWEISPKLRISPLSPVIMAKAVITQNVTRYLAGAIAAPPFLALRRLRHHSSWNEIRQNGEDKRLRHAASSTRTTLSKKSGEVKRKKKDRARLAAVPQG